MIWSLILQASYKFLLQVSQIPYLEYSFTAEKLIKDLCNLTGNYI